MALGRLGERGEVADCILLGAERAAGHAARRVVDAGHERRERAVGSEPEMPAAINLEELALARHPLPAAPVARRTTGPGRPHRGLREDPPEGALRDLEPLTLREQLGQVGVVHPGIRRGRELDDPTPELIVNTVDRWPAPVAVDEARRAVGVADDEAPDLAGREPEDPRRLVEGQAAGDHEVQDVGAVLGLSVLGFHDPRVTKSLAA